MQVVFIIDKMKKKIFKKMNFLKASGYLKTSTVANGNILPYSITSIKLPSSFK